jgi:hypothetical protein
MLRRTLLGASALVAALLATMPFTMAPQAQAPSDAKYPDLEGQWHRVGPNRWETGGQKAPLTPEYRAIYEANLARQAVGRQSDMLSWYCLPQGMPQMMNLYDPAEFVITPKITYVLISHVNDSYRRIYTDGRPWPTEDEGEPTFAGYSIGRWIDEDGDGRYDVLEVETRKFKGPRTYDGTGLPLHLDNQSVIKERISLDKADHNILHNQITVIDNALTQPWIVPKKARRDPSPRPIWRSAACAEDNSLVKIQNDAYFVTPNDGYLMPTYKDQPPPDLRYFKPK